MAATGVNVKMGVTGISQFKQNIATAKTSLKTLDAQLALNEKQFKATGDAEAYMDQKSELLQVRLKEQQSIVANAEKALDQMTRNGVDKASKQFQAMQQQLLQAKGDLLDTETALGNIGMAAEEADEGVGNMNASLQRIGQGVDYQNVTGALNTITSGMESAMKKAFELGRRLYNFTLGGGAWADELTVTAEKFGIKPEELLRMQKTARIIDTDAETILQAKQKLNKVIGQDLLTEGSGVADTLDALGLSNVISTDAEERFWQIGEAIKNMGDESIQEAAAQKLLGKSWRELIPLFDTGKEKYDEINESWNTVNDDQIKQLGEMDDQYQKMQSELETLQQQFQATFAEALTPVLETVTGLLSEFNQYLQTPEGKEALKSLGDAVSSLFTDLTKVSPEDVISKIKGLIDGLVDGLKWIYENKDTVVGFAEAFVGAWAALKLTSGMLTVLKLVNGIKGLAGAGAAEAAGASVGSSWGTAFASAVMKAAPWLVGLYEVLKPNENTHDEIGNNDLKDENGNLTNEALHYGYTLDNDGEVIKPNTQYEFEVPKPTVQVSASGEPISRAEMNRQMLERNHEFEKLTASSDKMTTTATELTESTNNQTAASQDMTAAANTLKGLPEDISKALATIINSIGIYLDGTQLVGYVSDQLGSGVLTD